VRATRAWSLDNGDVTSPASEPDEFERDWRGTVQHREDGQVRRSRNPRREHRVRESAAPTRSEEE
jgi:hypothetical protein